MPLEMTIDVTVMRKIRYKKLLQECSKTAKVATLISSGGRLPSLHQSGEISEPESAASQGLSQAGGRSG